MSSRTIILAARVDGGSEAALLEGTRLEDLLIDPPAGDTTPRPSEIYWAKIDRLVPKMGGAFVRLTPSHQGYLREAKGLRGGEGVLVQVIAYAEQGKAQPVTRRVLFKGPRLILTPDAPGINVSRRIGNTAERARLVDAVGSAASAFGEESVGIIIRTGARRADADELARELEFLRAEMRAAAAATSAPPPAAGPVAGRTDAVILALREWSFPELPRILASVPVVARLHGSVGGALWGSALLARAITGTRDDPFDETGVREQIEALASPRAALPSGGWMAVEPTAALIAVDVNTAGDFSGGAALGTNVEAARELPRQLRLHGLGGHITVDFAPLRKADRRRVEEALKAALGRDPVETTIAGWTPLGHLELQRRRERRPLAGSDGAFIR